MKAVKAKLPEDQHADFEKGASAFAKKIVANFKDFEFVSLCTLSYFHLTFRSNSVYWRVHEPRRHGCPP